MNILGLATGVANTVKKAYETAKKNYSSSSGGSSSSKSSSKSSSGGSSSGVQSSFSSGSNNKISYDKNTDYASAINNAYNSGASPKTLQGLYDARNAKIKDMNLSPSYAGSIGNKSLTTPYVNGDYEKDVDYARLIDSAQRNGASASSINDLINARNRKMAAEGITDSNPEWTNKVTQWNNANLSKENPNLGYDPNVDYAAVLKQMYANGASAEDIQSVLNMRDAKISATGMAPSQYDSNWTLAQRQANNSILRQKEAWDNYVKGFDQMKEDADAQTRAQIEQGRLQLEQQIPTINQNYENAARQAYIQYMQSRKDLPEQLAAQGINGGATESSMTALANQYGNSLASAKNEQTNALNNINNSIANLEASGNLQYAQNAYSIAQQQREAAMQALQQQQALEQQAYQNAFGYGQAIGNIGGSPTLDYLNAQNQWKYNDTSLAQNQQQLDQSQQEINNALQAQKWNQYYQLLSEGYTSDEAARFLGIPINKLPASYYNTVAETNYYNRR